MHPEYVMPSVAVLASLSYAVYWLYMCEHKMAGVFFFVAVLVPCLILVA